MASVIEDIYVNGTQVGSSKELSGMEIKQFQDEEGQPFYAKTHMDAIDGFEEYTEGLTQVAQLLGDYIFDTGWKEYDYNAGNGVKINARYTNDGFKCGIREIVLNPNLFGNGNQIRIKMIRINVENFASSWQLFQLPTGFIGKSQRFQMTGNGNRKPYTLETLSDGKVMVFIHPDEQSNNNSSNWIYGQYTWIE